MIQAEALDLLDHAAEHAGGVHSLQHHPGPWFGQLWSGQPWFVHAPSSRSWSIVAARAVSPLGTGSVSIHSAGVCSPAPRVTPRVTAGMPRSSAALASVLAAPNAAVRPARRNPSAAAR